MSQLSTSRRLPALDLARIIAMIMMIQGHTIYALADPNLIDYNSFPWNVWQIIRGFTAPVFLMVSGIVQVFANKRYENGKMKPDVVKKRIKTALMLAGIGYLLVFPAATIYDVFFIEYKFLLYFFKVNILQLFAACIIILLIVMQLTKSDKALGIVSFFIAIIITFSSNFVWQLELSYIPDFIKAYINNSIGSLFPIFPFAAYFFYGITFGVIIKKLNLPNTTMFLVKYGLIIALAFFLCSIPFSNYNFSFVNYINGMSTNHSGMILVRMSAVFVWITMSGILYLMSRKLENLYIILGKKSLYIYVIHLLLIYGSKSIPFITDYFVHNSMSLLDCLWAVLIVETISVGSIYLIDLAQRKFLWFNTLFRYLITSYLIYMLFV